MSKAPNSSNLAAFFRACRKTQSSSRGGTIAAEKSNIMQSPSLPVFRLHHQERKELCKSN